MSMISKTCIVHTSSIGATITQNPATTKVVQPQNNCTLLATCNYIMHMYILHNQGPRIGWKKNFQTQILKIITPWNDESTI
jgi:hypothetical protein